MDNVDYNVIYDFFDNLYIDPDSAFDMEDEDQISWRIDYGEDVLHLIVERESEYIGFSTLSIVSPVFELNNEEVNSQEKLLEIYEDILDLNFNLFQMSLAVNDNFVFQVYKLKLDKLDVEQLSEELEFFILQKRRLENILQ